MQMMLCWWWGQKKNWKEIGELAEREEVATEQREIKYSDCRQGKEVKEGDRVKLGRGEYKRNKRVQRVLCWRLEEQWSREAMAKVLGTGEKESDKHFKTRMMMYWSVMRSIGIMRMNRARKNGKHTGKYTELDKCTSTYTVKDHKIEQKWNRGNEQSMEIWRKNRKIEKKLLEGCTAEMRKGKNKKLKWEEERRTLSERRYDGTTTEDRQKKEERT